VKPERFAALLFAVALTASLIIAPLLVYFLGA